jgi:predicted lipoprotein with Yx(FWY)xxD motif
MRKTKIVTLLMAGLVLGAAAGCTQGGKVDGQGSPSESTQIAQTAEPPPPVALKASNTAELGPILTDAKGMTLYRFDKDTAKPPKSNCEGDCATVWLPVIAPSEKIDEITVEGIDRSLIGTVSRADGSLQVTVSGWSLYQYVKDTNPGDTKGQGAGGNWFAATPQGKKATGKPATDVTLVAMKVGKLGVIVTDTAGMTLYRFDKDTAKPSKANCEGECAATWPPVITSSSNIKVDGIDPALVGTVARADGSLQVTLAGWPLYHFAKDVKPCDTNGQGVGGVWFTLTAQGKKAGV